MRILSEIKAAILHERNHPTSSKEKDAIIVDLSKIMKIVEDVSNEELESVFNPDLTTESFKENSLKKAWDEITDASRYSHIAVLRSAFIRGYILLRVFKKCKPTTKLGKTFLMERFNISYSQAAVYIKFAKLMKRYPILFLVGISVSCLNLIAFLNIHFYYRRGI